MFCAHVLRMQAQSSRGRISKVGMRVVKQIRRCGVFESESTCQMYLALTVGFIASISVLGLAVFNTANTPSSAVLSFSNDLEGLMQDLREARNDLSKSFASSSSQHSSIAEAMLKLEKSLERLQEGETGNHTGTDSKLSVDSSGVEATSQPPPAPVVVQLYENCTIEMLAECMVKDESLVEPSTTTNLTFSSCTVTYTSGDHILDTPDTPLSNVFCSVKTAGNFTNPVSSSLSYNMEDNMWKCLCHGYKVKGVEFTEFDCQMFGTFCPNSFDLPTSS